MEGLSTLTIAIVAIGKHGSILAQRVHRGLADSDLYLPERFSLDHGAQSFSSIKELLPGLFRQYRGLVLFMPAGAAIRLLAGVLKDKYHDPGVVVVDEAGRFAVSLLSGHTGGANRLADQVASILGCQPVITSAAEALGTIAVDLLGKDFGWKIENPAALTAVSAAITNGEPVGIFQEAGETDWWPLSSATCRLPPNIRQYSSLAALEAAGCAAAIIISDRSYDLPALKPENMVILRPRSLVVGLGLHRGISGEAIEQGLLSTLSAFSLSPLSLRLLATIATRQGEEGIGLVARKHNMETVFFEPRTLKGVSGLPNPSALVARHLGLDGVCEPAAILASENGELLVQKQKLGDITVAVARYNFAHA